MIIGRVMTFSFGALLLLFPELILNRIGSRGTGVGEWHRRLRVGTESWFYSLLVRLGR